MNELYEIKAPDFWCSAHAADGSRKHIAKSESMCISERKSLHNNLKSVAKNFSFGVKSREQLDQAIETVNYQDGSLCDS